MQINNNLNANLNQPHFGSTAKLAKKVLNDKTLKKISDNMEFDGPSMSMPAMMGMLYGATIIPRLVMADDKHDRREIMLRDFTSITAILFGAKALSKGFSEKFQKSSGFVLNEKTNANATVKQKILNYLNPTGGINVLGSTDLKSKYSNLEKFKDGIDGFNDFINKKGGDLKKVLSFDGTVKENVEKLVGKPIKEFASGETLAKAIKEAPKKGSEALKNIYETFKNPKNVYVKKAQTMNSAFGFVSTIVLVPALMYGIQKANEAITNNILKKQKAKTTQNIAPQDDKKEIQPQKAQKVAITHSENAKKAFSKFLK